MKNKRLKVYNLFATVLLLASIVISSVYIDIIDTNGNNEIRIIGKEKTQELSFQKDLIIEKNLHHVGSVNLAVGEFLSINNTR